MALVKRILALAGVVSGAILYVWFAAVRARPRVRQRKAELRQRHYPGPPRRTPPR